MSSDKSDKIGLFFGSDTGVTEGIAMRIQELLGEDTVEVNEIYEVKPEDFEPYSKLILGLSTWHDGELQSDWDEFFESFTDIDFTGKTVAIFGLGDQYGYSMYYCDGIGVLGKIVQENGGTLIGKWSTEGYEHDESKAELEDEEMFMGLALDEDNQEDMTDERVEQWAEQLKEEFGLKQEA